MNNLDENYDNGKIKLHLSFTYDYLLQITALIKLDETFTPIKIDNNSCQKFK